MQLNLLEVGLNSLSNNIFNLASDLKQNSIFIGGINKEKSLVSAIAKIKENIGYYALYLTETDYAKFTKLYSVGDSGEYLVESSVVFPVVSNKSYVNFIDNIVNFKNKNNFTTYKLFNLPTNKIKAFLDVNNVKSLILSDGLDVKVKLDLTTLTEEERWEFLRKFLIEFKDFIYAESDVSLAMQLVKILKMRGIKASTAESFTAGGVASYITSISGSSEVFYEGIVAYNEDAKNDRLNVEKATLITKHPVSSQTCYEMCKGVLNKGADVAVATTGLAGPNSDVSMLPVGLVFIAVGTTQKISVYKYNFTGSRKDITDKGIQTAVFLMIKALRDGSFNV